MTQEIILNLIPEEYKVPEDIGVFGLQVKTFPLGIEEAFDGLIKMLGAENKRDYSGISECTPEGIVYIAAALETFAGEAEKYGFQKYTIEKGDYFAIKVSDWRSKTGLIKQVFEQIFKYHKGDRTKPCIEIYKDDYEMYCLVKADARKVLQDEFELLMKEFKQTVSAFDEEQLNILPFEGSWTGGQVVEHLYLSNTGFAQLVNGPVVDTERAPDEWVETIKAEFMDLNKKTTSPEFVLPKQHYHRKEELISWIQEMDPLITTAIQKLDLNQTCLFFELPVCGYLTRLEALTFVIYHSKRHLHQLKQILKLVVEKPELEMSI